MRGGWGMPEDTPKVDFDNVLAQSKTGLDLLKVDDITDEIKNYSSNFTSKYPLTTHRIIRLKHRAILFDLIEVAINPRRFM